MRVLTANLWSERGDVGIFGDLVTALAADIVAVQELGYAAAAVLADLLPHGLLLSEAGTSGKGLALRFPGKVGGVPMPLRAGIAARLDPGEWPNLTRELEVINVHMASPILWPIRRSVAYRRGQLAALLEHVSAPAPRLVVGDFNASPVWPLYRRMAARMDDAVAEAARGQGRRPARTWGPTERSPRLLRIDHVFTEGLRPTYAAALSLPGSDHRAVVVDVVENGTPSPPFP